MFSLMRENLLGQFFQNSRNRKPAQNIDIIHKVFQEWWESSFSFVIGYIKFLAQHGEIFLLFWDIVMGSRDLNAGARHTNLSHSALTM